jgi:hypothetical protein
LTSQFLFAIALKYVCQIGIWAHFLILELLLMSSSASQTNFLNRLFPSKIKSADVFTDGPGLTHPPRIHMVGSMLLVGAWVGRGVWLVGGPVTARAVLGRMGGGGDLDSFVHGDNISPRRNAGVFMANGCVL